MWIGKRVVYPRRNLDFSEGVVISHQQATGIVSVRDFSGELWQGHLHQIALL
ncbi:hypothetical protein [Motilimonas sp. KMU-193]|uniref:hypothetical protein n=1 Tax=Motilimonas sp. KMU-193 TaxID=3388668 RepID=UPI00396B2D9B